jgi:DNA-binding transcriptional ArsR family regulator
MGPESDPTEVFELVSDPTRVGILRALADAHADDPADPWLAYSDLRAAVGVRDKGNFNYHLDRLDGLVATGPEGYRLSRVGMELVSAVASGVLDPEWTWGPVDAPGDCPFCDDPVVLYYEDGVLWLSCGTDAHEMGLGAPPGLLASHPEDEVVELVAFLGNRWGELVRRGVCSECRGRVEGRIEYGGVGPDHYHYHGDCRRCGFQHGVPLGPYLLGHPAVLSFHFEHGVDVRSRPFWTLEFCAPGAETVVSEEPLRLRVDVDRGGDRLSLTVDREGTVVSTERTAAPAG